jgi:isoleucyl-tRNA synthetase
MLGRLLAPFVPHVAEAIHGQAPLRAGESVHLLTWPAVEEVRGDDDLLGLFGTFQQLAGLGWTARSSYGVDADVGLPVAIIGHLSPGPFELSVEALAVLARKLNVGRVEVIEKLPAVAAWRLGLGSEVAARRTVASSEVEASLSALDAETASALVAELWRGLSVSVDLGGSTVVLLPQEVEVRVEARPGWAVAGGKGWVVALQTG